MNNQADQRIKKNGLRGQNVIEYLLLLIAVVVVLFFFLNPKDGHMKNALDNVLNDTVNDILHLNSELNFDAP